MKKIIFLAIATITAIVFISCEGDDGPMGPAGPTGPKGEPGYGTEWSIKEFTVAENEWILSGKPGDLNSFFYADKSFSDLTDYVFKEGSILAYIETAKGIKNGLPYVLHLGQEGENNKEFLWTQTYDFDFWVGGVRFYLTYSDFNTDLGPEKESKKFHVVLMY